MRSDQHLPFALSGRRSLMFDHEILTRARAVLKQIVPSFALRHDHAAAADLQNVDPMHLLRKGDILGQTDGLAAIAGEYGGTCHGIISV